MTNSCPKQNIFLRLIIWHYWQALREIVFGWLNLLKFNLRWFAIGLLFKTLFSHWRRYGDSYGRGFDLKVYLNAFAGNAIARVIGLIIRLVIIIVGLLFEIAIFFAGLVLIISWILLPLIIILAIWSGVYFLQPYYGI